MQVNIIITTKSRTQNQKTINTTVSYVSPTATNQQLLQLATMLNNFTTNTFVVASKETKEEL